MNKLLRLAIIWFITGSFYFVLEGLWRIPEGGYANIAMLPVGGICGVLIGGLNQHHRYYKMKILWQALFGTLIILTIEFISGYILNIKMGMHIWDYSNLPFNIMGQISLRYGILWFFLIPFGIWFEDSIRYELWGEGEEYGLLTIYKELFTYQ
jgi:uncharacterized membrane protein YsdA (DUF1294 family)